MPELTALHTVTLSVLGFDMGQLLELRLLLPAKQNKIKQETYTVFNAAQIN